MTRRLTVAIVGVVAGALVLAGLGTLVLVRLGARRETRTELERQATALAPAVNVVTAAEQAPRLSRRPNVRRVFDQLSQAFQLQGIDAVVLRRNGTVNGEVPDGIDLADLESRADDLTAGVTVSGTHGGLVYAAAPVERPASTLVVILTRNADNGLRSGGRWFTLAAVVALLTAVAVAATLGSRLTRPVRAAEEATRRIAAGDLSARVPEPGGHDELASLSASINAMAGELERAQGLERQFLLSVSHDLRTPLTSIRGFAEAIAEGTAPDTPKAAGVILVEARRLERLVRDLLDLARLDARRFSLDLRATDVAEVVVETTEGFRPAADAVSVELRVDTRDSDQVAVRADPDRLAQVVANLVENALKFAHSRIGVEAAVRDGHVDLWVDDDGPGIAPEDLPHVFERLYTSARRPARQAPGSGLGLAIVHELVDAMGGSVRAEPLPAGGTRITVALASWAH